MLDLSFIYAAQAAEGDALVRFVCWIAASVLCALLTVALKAFGGKRGFSRNRHLLLQLDRRRAFGNVSLVCCMAALLWNARHLAYEPWLYLALAVEMACCAYRLRGRSHMSDTIELSVISISSAVVLAVSPVALSPVALLSVCHCVFSGNGWKRFAVSVFAVPAVVYVVANLWRNPEKWLLGLALAMACVLCVCMLLTLRYRREAVRYRQKLDAKQQESDDERRRMDELELNIIRSERENLLNMLDIRRQEVRDTAEKMTDQSLFMQEIYEMVCRAQNSGTDAERADLLQEMKSKIQLRMNFSDERTNFNQHVEELHKDFSIRLQARYPGLSAQERKLAAMLRLEFPTKYMAVILNISPKSVEIERHRLRKKFGLDRKTKLTDFVKSI